MAALLGDEAAKNNIWTSIEALAGGMAAMEGREPRNSAVQGPGSGHMGAMAGSSIRASNAEWRVWDTGLVLAK